MKPLEVLVCDDEQSICLLLQDLLEQLGHRVMTFQDGAAAVAAAAERPIDLAFLDIRMPGMSGDKVLKRMREIRPETIFVMITGYAQDDVVEEALNSGAAVCLSKPFSITQAMKLLEQVTSGEPVSAQS
jgi:CheY-like chemotaxis protein